MINEEVEPHTRPRSEGGGRLKHSAHKAVKQNIKGHAGLKQTSEGREGAGGKVSSFVFICGFHSKR